MLIITSQRGILHKLEQSSLCDFVFIEDIEKLEKELQVILLLLVNERLNRHVVILRLHWDLKVVLEAWSQNSCHLIRDGQLVTFLQVCSELLLIAQAFLGEALVEPFDKSWVIVRIELLLDGHHGFGGSLSLVVGLFVRCDAGGTGVTAGV